MEKLLDVIERKDALVIALSDGHIRAVDLTALKPETEAEMSAEELCAAGKKIYTVLSEDMEPRAAPSVGSVPAPSSSKSTRESLSAFSIKRTTLVI